MELPTVLSSCNKNNFYTLKLEYYQKIIYNDIYINIINNNQFEYFDISQFKRQHKLDTVIMDTLITNLILELTKIGWKTQLAYGNTGLFIYDNELPVNCWF